MCGPAHSIPHLSIHLPGCCCCCRFERLQLFFLSFFFLVVLEERVLSFYFFIFTRAVISSGTYSVLFAFAFCVYMRAAAAMSVYIHLLYCFLFSSFIFTLFSLFILRRPAIVDSCCCSCHAEFVYVCMCVYIYRTFTLPFFLCLSFFLLFSFKTLRDNFIRFLPFTISMKQSADRGLDCDGCFQLSPLCVCIVTELDYQVIASRELSSCGGRFNTTTPAHSWILSFFFFLRQGRPM